METEEKQAFIRGRVLENQQTPGKDKVLWSRHAIERLAVEGWRRSWVVGALQVCQVTEDYPVVGRPLPDCLALAFLEDRSMHAVVAIDESRARIFVVTVYLPSPEWWEDDWQTRKP